ncbi:MAG: hypothetical protein E6Q93_26510, partial [Burkholderiaceae bacterium]
MADFKEVPADAPVAQKVTTWFENRFPTAFAAYRVHMSEYYAPKNFNFWYFFGSLALLIRGDYVVSDATLNRFFSFHVIAVPLVLLGLVVAHLIALHEVGSNNPDGIEIKAKKDANGIPMVRRPPRPTLSPPHFPGATRFRS